MASSSSSSDDYSGSSSNDDDDETKKKKRQMLAELQIAKRFVSASQRGMKTLRQKSRSSAEEVRLYPRERKELPTLGIKEGLFAGTVTLIALRRRRSYILSRNQQRVVAQFQQQQQQQQRGLTTPPPPNKWPESWTTHHVQNGPFQSAAQTNKAQQQQAIPPPPGGGGGDAAAWKPSFISRAYGWALDIAASLCATVAVARYFTDADENAKRWSRIPLIEGRSTVADHFCPPALEVYRSVCQQKRGDGDGGTTTTPEEAVEVLRRPTTRLNKKYVEFCRNCVRRSIYENQLRRDRGLLRSIPVEIPAPGVPESIAPPIDPNTDLLIIGSENHHHEEEDHQEDGPFYDPSYAADDDDGWNDGGGGGTSFVAAEDGTDRRY